MSSLGETGLKAATGALALTVQPFLASSGTFRTADLRGKITISSYRYSPLVEAPVAQKRRPLSSYSDAELSALYAPTADEDRDLASLGLAAWAHRLEACG
jgi:hypothetical protein